MAIWKCPKCGWEASSFDSEGRFVSNFWRQVFSHGENCEEDNCEPQLSKINSPKK